jgi:hypothetical protein
MRYVFYAFVSVATVLVWVQNTEKGHHVKRVLSERPVDASWSH